MQLKGPESNQVVLRLTGVGEFLIKLEDIYMLPF